MVSNYSSLTAKQKKVYAVIENYLAVNGIPPTVREIGELVGEKTPGAVQGILNRLEQKGVIKRQLGAARSIQLVSENDQMYSKPVFIPKIKRITKRNLDNLTSIYNIERYIPFAPEVLTENTNIFLYEAPNDGLEESGFTSDATILVNQSAEPIEGDIVLVFFETRAILRRYYGKEDGMLVLKADSSIVDKENFQPDEIIVIGKVEGRYTRF